MGKYEKISIAIGITQVILGALVTLSSLGLLSISIVPLAVSTPEGRAGVDIYTLPYQSLSIVSYGKEYQWELTAKNTGEIPWSSAWTTIRIGIDGSVPVKKEFPGSLGVGYVEKCDGKIDDETCREDIEGEWKITYASKPCSEATSEEFTTPTCELRVCSLTFGEVAPGEEKKLCFKVTVPKTSGRYPLITNLVAYVGFNKIVDSEIDWLNVNVIDPMLAVGIAITLVGMGLMAYGFSKK